MSSALPGLEFLSPTRFVFGFGVSARLAVEARGLGGTRALVVTERSTAQHGGAAAAFRALDDGRLPYTVYDGVAPGAPIGLVAEALDVLTADGCDLVVGLGGGDALAVARCVAVTATNDVDVWGMLGHGRVPRRGLPTIMACTTCQAGADTGSAAVLRTDGDAAAYGVVESPFLLADVVVNDPGLTPGETAEAQFDGSLGTLVAGIECLTGAQPSLLSDFYSESVVRMCVGHLPVVVADAADREARYNLALAGSMAGWASMSAPAGVTGALAQGVAAVCGCTAGRAAAAVLPAFMRHRLRRFPAPFVRIAEILSARGPEVADFKVARLAATAVEELLDSLGVACRLSHCGLRREQLPRVADLAWQHAGMLSASGESPLGRREVEDLLGEAF